MIWFGIALFLIIREIYLFSLRLLTVSDLKVPKVQFIRIVLDEIERKFNTNKPFNLEVRYYQPQQVHGRYYFNTNLMVIYISPRLSLLELVDTILHEYCHHLQNHSGKKERSKALELYNREYWDHPWEVQARYLASKMGLQVLKKILFIFSLSLMFASCGTTKELVYLDENGECYPTIKSIDQMYKRRTETGLKYVCFDCKWVTPAQRDSIALVENDRIFDKFIQTCDTVNTKQIQ